MITLRADGGCYRVVAWLAGDGTIHQRCLPKGTRDNRGAISRLFIYKDALYTLMEHYERDYEIWRIDPPDAHCNCVCIYGDDRLAFPKQWGIDSEYVCVNDNIYINGTNSLTITMTLPKPTITSHGRLKSMPNSMPLRCDEWTKQPPDSLIANDIKIGRKAGSSDFPFDYRMMHILSRWGDVVLVSINNVFLAQYHTGTHQIIWTTQIKTNCAAYASENVIIYILGGGIRMLINASDGTQYSVC